MPSTTVWRQRRYSLAEIFPGSLSAGNAMNVASESADSTFLSKNPRLTFHIVRTTHAFLAIGQWCTTLSWSGVQVATSQNARGFPEWQYLYEALYMQMTETCTYVHVGVKIYQQAPLHTHTQLCCRSNIDTPLPRICGRGYFHCCCLEIFCNWRLYTSPWFQPADRLIWPNES